MTEAERNTLRRAVDEKRRLHLAPTYVTAPRKYRRKPRTHCKNGHEFNEENTYLRGHGARQCLICKRVYSLEWYYARKRAA